MISDSPGILYILLWFGYLENINSLLRGWNRGSSVTCKTYIKSICDPLSIRLDIVSFNTRQHGFSSNLINTISNAAFHFIVNILPMKWKFCTSFKFPYPSLLSSFLKFIFLFRLCKLCQFSASKLPSTVAMYTLSMAC